MLAPFRIESKSNTLLSGLTNWPFACKTKTLDSLYSHALLIPTKSSKSKNQVMHEQKFKDPLNSTCPLSSESVSSSLWKARLQTRGKYRWAVADIT